MNTVVVAFLPGIFVPRINVFYDVVRRRIEGSSPEGRTQCRALVECARFPNSIVSHLSDAALPIPRNLHQIPDILSVT